MAKIIFVLRNPTFFRFVEAIIRSLLEHNHNVTLISPQTSRLKDSSFDISNSAMMIDAKAAHNGPAENLMFVPLTDRRRRTTWVSVTRTLRTYACRVSGEDPWSDPQREWCVTLLPYFIQRVFNRAGRDRVEALLKLRIVRAVLARGELLLRPQRAVVLQLRDLNPDLVIVTPAIYPFYSAEVDYLKATRRLGRRSCVLVASWDNLTTTGMFPMVPDAVLVWNEAQVEEAVHIHGLPRDIIAVVGAPVFDQWFSLGYREPREDFCQRAGLNPAQPYVVYAVSSPIVGNESAIAVRLAGELTARAGDLGIQVLVRPHPNLRRGLDRLTESGLYVWPPVGVFPLTTDQKRDYFNTLYHAAAVVGLNTSVFLEAMILDKPCVSIATEVAARAPFKHYEHLVNADCCEFVADEAAAAAAVIDLLRGRDTRCEARRRFIEAFIRPRGLNEPAASAAVDVIEALCSPKDSSAAGSSPKWLKRTMEVAG
jgi:hypothetical protein